jgi:ABC-type microcin C transport system permease subunit YejE
MAVALGTDIEVIFELFFPDNLPATFALDPQTFRAHTLLIGLLDFAGFSLKPGQSHSHFQ